MRSRYAVVAVVAFLAALAAVLVTRTVMTPAPGGESEIHALLHDGLTLDAAQQARIATLERDFATRRATLDAAMQAQNRRLAAAIAREHGYGPGVAAAVDGTHRVMGEQQKETLRHIFAMRGVLRPDQAARYDATVVKVLTAPSR